MKKKYLFAVFILLLVLLSSLLQAYAEEPAINSREDQFSFVWISDTQTLTEKPSLASYIPDIFNWIIYSKNEYNTLSVFHTGDIVENGWNQLYWDRINAGIDILPANLPLIAAAGNHDVAKRYASYEPWLKQDFVKKEIPENQYKNGEGYYHLFYPGKEKIVAVSIGYNSIDQEGMDWVQSVFERYSDHTGILITHSFTSYIKGNDYLFTKEGKKLFENVVVPCNNVKLVLCGHIHGNDTYAARLTETDGSERIVNILRYDYQYAFTPDRIGYIRILRFNPEDRSIEVMTYSPIQDNMHYFFDDPKNEHFYLEDAF